jgi:hypothetical protein
MSLRGKAAVVGVAESDLGEVGPGFTPLDLIGQATVRALDDAGLEKSDVDGLFSASAYHHMPTLSAGEYLERVMNSIGNSLGMRETEIAKEPSRPWNPHSYAVFAQVHNTL